MATTNGATITMEETRARDYYKRSGFNHIPVRDRKGVRRRANLYQIREYNLEIDEVVELTVYPELVLRSKPWHFWGRVVRFYNNAVVLRQMDGEQAGTIIRIPYRYFMDGRVIQKKGEDDE